MRAGAAGGGRCCGGGLGGCGGGGVVWRGCKAGRWLLGAPPPSADCVACLKLPCVPLVPDLTAWRCSSAVHRFLANLTCMLTSMWPLGGSLPSASPAPRLLVQQSSVGAPGAESGFGLPQDLLHAAGAAAAAGGGGGAAAGGLGDGGLGGSYWLQRLGVLQQELQLLQGRLEFVTREVNVVMSHLAQAGAAAAAAAAGAPGGEGATATAAAGGPVGQEL